jgi:Mn-containing catalase
MARRKKTLLHLLTREITHANMFMRTLDDWQMIDSTFGNVPPDNTVTPIFNLSLPPPVNHSDERSKEAKL